LMVTTAVTFSVLTLVILFLFSILELIFSFQTQQQVIVGQQLNIAQHAAETVSSFIKEKFAILDQAADINNLALSPDRRELIMSKMLGRESSFRQLLLTDMEGRELQMVTRSSIITPSPFQEYKESILAEMLKERKYISPVYIDETTNELLILIAVSANDIFHKPQGILMVEINLKFMWDLVSGISVGQEGLAYVVDKEGKLIAFKDTSRVLKDENLAGLKEVAEFMRGEIDDEPGAISKGIVETYVTSVFVPLHNPDWAMIIEIPILEAYAAVLQRLGYMLLAMLFSGILAAIGGVYFSRKITKGIITLTSVAKEISHGNLDTKIEIDSENKENEIGNLATSFNLMAGKLKDLYANLEEKVREKTTELAFQVVEVEKSKSAVLNLLEDLEVEKASVEHKVVERTRELAEEKAEFVASITGLPLGFVLIDKQQNVILHNSSVEKILGVNEQDLNLNKIAELFDSKFSFKENYNSCMTEKKIINENGIMYGSKFLHLFMSPVEMIHDHGEIIGVVILIEDITEEKVLERSREEFFSIASHEMRTPLTAIRGNMSLIKDFFGEQMKDPEVKQMIEDSYQGSVRLIGVVNDFLDASRLEQGRISFQKEKLDFSVLIEDVARDLKKESEEKGLSLIFERAETPMVVLADNERTKQVIINLISNAIHYSSKGNIIVSLAKEDGFIKCSVSDTGGGISTQNQNLLFRKFQQAGEKMLARDVSKGTGLGLYISKLLVEAMGGKIWLERSELGKGSVFIFTLPATQ